MDLRGRDALRGIFGEQPPYEQLEGVGVQLVDVELRGEELHLCELFELLLELPLVPRHERCPQPLAPADDKQPEAERADPFAALAGAAVPRSAATDLVWTLVTPEADATTLGLAWDVLDQLGSPTSLDNQLGNGSLGGRPFRGKPGGNRSLRCRSISG